MRELPPELVQELAEALSHAFQEAGQLKEFVATSLTFQTDEIIFGNRPLSEHVLELIRWANREGRLEDLAQRAAEKRPGNQPLSRATTNLLAFLRTAPRFPAPALDPVRRPWIRILTNGLVWSSATTGVIVVAARLFYAHLYHPPAPSLATIPAGWDYAYIAIPVWMTAALVYLIAVRMQQRREGSVRWASTEGDGARSRPEGR
jgi:hypothetical protein